MKVLSSGVDVPIDEWASSRPTNLRPRVIPSYAGTETILLVDDERVIRNLLTVFLERYGYTVLAATDGEHAIEIAAAYQAPIHLLLSDVVMPNLDGCGLTTELRRWYPSIGVLLMSGNTDGATAALEVEGESTYFISKPFDPAALASAVRSAIASRPMRDP